MSRFVQRVGGQVKRWRRLSTQPRRPPVELGSLSPMRMVPEHIPRPPYVGGSPPHNMPALELHDGKGINAMRRAGRLSAEVLDFAGSLVKPGVTTDEIDELVHEFIVTRDAYPSPLGYGNFPKSVCTSVNEVVCHGIPDRHVLQTCAVLCVAANSLTHRAPPQPSPRRRRYCFH